MIYRGRNCLGNAGLALHREADRLPLGSILVRRYRTPRARLFRSCVLAPRKMVGLLQ
jgi:hypothetical protein